MPIAIIPENQPQSDNRIEQSTMELRKEGDQKSIRMVTSTPRDQFNFVSKRTLDSNDIETPRRKRDAFEDVKSVFGGIGSGIKGMTTFVFPESEDVFDKVGDVFKKILIVTGIIILLLIAYKLACVLYKYRACLCCCFHSMKNTCICIGKPFKVLNKPFKSKKRKQVINLIDMADIHMSEDMTRTISERRKQMKSQNSRKNGKGKKSTGHKKRRQMDTEI